MYVCPLSWEFIGLREQMFGAEQQVPGSLRGSAISAAPRGQNGILRFDPAWDAGKATRGGMAENWRVAPPRGADAPPIDFAC
jgi:hypothetical protein